MHLTFSSPQGKLIEISLYSNMKNVQYKKLDVFSNPPQDVYETLCKEDGDARVTAGVTVLLNIGIALTGFQNDDVSDDSITVLAKGRWANDDSELKPASDLYKKG